MEELVVFAILVGLVVDYSLVAKSVAGSFVKVVAAAADPSVVTIEIQKEVVVEIEIVAWEFLVG